MKIVNIIGGLGNQLFQYAFAVALKIHNPNEDVLLDITHFNSFFFRKYKGRNLHNGFELDNILDKVVIPKAKASQIILLSNYIPNYLISRFVRKYLPKRKHEYLEKIDFKFDPDALSQKGNIYYEGYWQVANYFIEIEDQIKNAFKFQPLDNENLKWIEKLQNTKSVSIHVRRGDYVNNKGFGGICDLNYYSKALNYVLSNIEEPIFYVFSNDIEWCENNIRPLMNGAECIFINHNRGKNSYKDMQLMSFCRTNIIANSSFSWWGAFLNNNEEALVIAPAKWNNFSENIDVYHPRWIKIQ